MSAVLLSAADGFVIAMLAMMVVSLGVVALLFGIMRRNAARQNREVEKLLEEVAAEEEREKRAPAHSEAPDREPWEKDGDWWKQ